MLLYTYQQMLQCYNITGIVTLATRKLNGSTTCTYSLYYVKEDSTVEPSSNKIQAYSAQMIIKVKGHQHWWLAGGYDLQEDIFRAG